MGAATEEAEEKADVVRLLHGYNRGGGEGGCHGLAALMGVLEDVPSFFRDAAACQDSQWHRRNQRGHNITRIVAAPEDMGAAIASEYVSTHSHHHLRGCESHLSLRGCAYHLRDSQWHRRNQQGHKITRIVAASEDMGAAIASEYVSTHSHHHLRGCESHLSLRGCAYHLRVREFCEYTPRAGIPFQ
ncbi:hypothetical protein TRIUR3_04371 [Triticum urartu]|uniref:Uncharacterized protein n=1 Tax=Triticum urartu TaxID=4572 RepID=M7ZVK9_TRIUA|nr:hypothetical protein TRIUR3_04371 [Triticum urartu]